MTKPRDASAALDHVPRRDHSLASNSLAVLSPMLGESARFPVLSTWLPALAIAAYGDATVNDMVFTMGQHNRDRMKIAIGPYGARFSHGFDARCDALVIIDSARGESHLFDVSDGRAYSDDEYVDWFCQVVESSR